MSTTSVPVQVSARKAWGIVAALSFFALVNFLDKVALGLVAVPMMKELELTSVQFGILGGSIYWLFALAGIAGGFAANRYQARWLLLGMAVIWSVVQLPLIFTSSFTLILIARIILGVGEGPAAPVQYHAIYKWFPNNKRNLPVSLINLGSTLALLVAGIMIPLITAKWGWRANFFILSVVGFVWVALWLFVGAEGPIDDSTATTNKAAEQGSQAKTSYAKLLLEPTAFGLIVIHFLAFWGLANTLTWLPAYMQKGLGFAGVEAGRWFGLVVIIGIPITLAISWYSQRLLTRGRTSRVGRAWVTSISLFVAGLAYLLLMAVDLTAFQKILLLAIGTGIAPVIYALAPAMMSEIVPPAQRGAMLAIENSIASTAGILAPVVSGKLIDLAGVGSAIGYEQGFALTGLLLVIGGLVGALLIHPERTNQKRSSAA